MEAYPFDFNIKGRRKSETRSINNSAKQPTQDFSIKHLIVKKKGGNNDKMHGWLLGSSVTYVMYLMTF